MIKNSILAITLFFLAINANAALVLDITDVGGNAQIQFSGSSYVATSGNANNGLWLNDAYFTGLFNFPSAATQNGITSGFASLSRDNVVTNFQNTWWNGSQYSHTLALYTSPGLNQVNAGEVWSWTGTLLTTLDFNYFNLGSFAGNQLGPYTNGPTFINNIIVNVGGSTAVPVPEPSIIALMSLGILGFGLSRRKMKK